MDDRAGTACRRRHVKVESIVTLNSIIMLGIFRKKSKREKLQKQYKKLMKEWHALSRTDRTASDRKYEEAEAILKQIAIIDGR